MLKRISALILCVLMVVSCFASCGSSDINEDNPGAYISMYLTDEVYDFDPANAYNNDSALQIVSLLFTPLFTLSENGKVSGALVKEYEKYDDFEEGDHKLTLTLNSTGWSDGVPVSANDVVFSFKRILEVESTSEAASLLFDIRNARKIKEGDLSIDTLGVYAVNTTTVEIYLEEKIDKNGKAYVDYDGFLRNLTSYALCPLREVIVSRTTDWAKKPATMVTSGPFKIRNISYENANKGLTLERNPHYMRNDADDLQGNPIDRLDKSVTPYRLIVDYTKSDADILAAYQAGEIFYMGDIPLSIRGEVGEDAIVEDIMATHTYYLNENAEIGGIKLFSDPAVRKALSLAIDRDAIAEKVVYAKAATGLVPHKVYDSTSRKVQFADKNTTPLAGTADLSAAKAALAQATVAGGTLNPADYSFSVLVAAYDDVHMAIAEMVVAAWNALGFNVTIEAVDVVVNDDLGTTSQVPTDIRDDECLERVRVGDYQVAAFDLVAYTTDAFNVLAPFAKGFTGQGMDMDLRDPETGDPYYVLPTHITGFDNEEYTALIEKAYAATSAAERSAALHEAETFLLEQMPVIPVVFNQSAKLISKDLSSVKTNFYGLSIFNTTKQKNYENYIPVKE